MENRNMKKIILFIISILLCACNKTASSVCNTNDNKWYDQYHVVAHALGAIDGYDYTNTKEAFEYHYSQGTRVFEIDLQQTSDGKFALVHEWDQYHDKLIDVECSWIVDSTTFKENLIYGKYTPLLLDDILSFTQEYCDVYWIIDSKTFDIVSTQAFYESFIEQVSSVDGKLLSHFIPQAYSPDIYNEIDSFEAFDDIIFTLYAYYADHDGWQAYEFIKEKNITVVVMHMNDDWAIRVIEDIRDYAYYDNYLENLRIYIHTIDDFNTADYIVNQEGFDGIYSDEITENSWDSYFN